MGDPGFRQLAVRDLDIVVPSALNLSLSKQYWFCGKVSKLLNVPCLVEFLESI
jgi:hypothetical protein